MLPYLREAYGNASVRSHSRGIEASIAVERSRRDIASAIGASPEEIYFTSGATEANNLALMGVAGHDLAHPRGIVTTSIEHASVREVIEAHVRRGAVARFVPANDDGIVDPAHVRESITNDTILVSVMHANNEIGSVQPLELISAACRDHGVYIHTDAAQTLGKIPFNVDSLGVDMASFSAHKIHGPKGIGALYVRSRRLGGHIQPVQFGGSHERGMRPGTLNVPGIVGMAAAVRIACNAMDERAGIMRRLRNELWREIRSGFPSAQINGPDPTAGDSTRMPNNLNIWFPGIDATALLRDARSVEASTGSACAQIDSDPSRVLLSMYPHAPERARQSVRLGLSVQTTRKEVLIAARALVLAANEIINARARWQADLHDE